MKFDSNSDTNPNDWERVTGKRGEMRTTMRMPIAQYKYKFYHFYYEKEQS